MTAARLVFALALFTGVLALAPGRRSATAAAPAPPAGFTPLLNGTDLAGWHGWAIHLKGAGPDDLDALPPEAKAKKQAAWTDDAKKHWTVQNGELVNDGNGAYLATDKDYADVELRLEYKTVAKADSGVYLRATPQVQIWDTTKDGGKWDRGADKGSGGLFNSTKGAVGQLPLAHADKPFGEWNALRIVQVGERTTVFLNGTLVVDHARMENYWKRGLPLRKAGPILLQTHGGEIRWRNLAAREIPPAEANERLRKHGADGFAAVFNGKDLTGWAGALDNYEVTAGAIACKPKKGGNVYTTGEYGDFVARLEYRLPPGGNNGLALRYPGGAAHAATQGMCELQLLDDTDPQYAKLDPRQSNGSAYGMAAAHRGYLRPVGEWNFLEVTARGSTLRAELNGTRVLDTDLSKVTEFMGKQPHPGKDRARGHFGFAGHNDPVAFRNIEIRKLSD